MPAVAKDAIGAKLVCFFPKNAGSEVPTHLAMIALFEPETGQLAQYASVERVGMSIASGFDLDRLRMHPHRN
jgi:ornithine cyclodeaminase/alanine dehydrogenase-like protein (mu-crystallin family)